MIGQAPDSALQLRALAARFRAHSAQTGLHLYQRKFEGAAAELEEAALDAETRYWARQDLKLVS